MILEKSHKDYQGEKAIYWYRDKSTEIDPDCMFGVSSLSLKGMTLREAIVSAKKAGFEVFELVPQVFRSIETYTPRIRQNLRRMLEEFSLVTIHTSDILLEEGVPADLTSNDALVREKSINKYLDYLQLALDVGARVITFHPSQKDKLTTCTGAPVPYIEFAEIALEFIDDEDILMGYEFFDVELIQTIGDPRFGLLFDVGHAAALFQGEATDGVLRLLDSALMLTVEVHLHGVDFSRSGSKIDHVPFSNSRAINYRRVFELLTDASFSGPLVFEIGIFNKSAAYENLKHSVDARDKVLEQLRKT